MRFYAEYRTASTRNDKRKYNYNCIEHLEEPVRAAGTKITAVAAWDNSARNPANPNPDRAVDWGNESWDEMFFGAVSWKFENQSGED